MWSITSTITTRPYIMLRYYYYYYYYYYYLILLLHNSETGETSDPVVILTCKCVLYISSVNTAHFVLVLKLVL